MFFCFVSISSVFKLIQYSLPVSLTSLYPHENLCCNLLVNFSLNMQFQLYILLYVVKMAFPGTWESYVI